MQATAPQDVGAWSKVAFTNRGCYSAPVGTEYRSMPRSAEADTCSCQCPSISSPGAVTATSLMRAPPYVVVTQHSSLALFSFSFFFYIFFPGCSSPMWLHNSFKINSFLFDMCCTVYRIRFEWLNYVMGVAHLLDIH